MLLAFLLDGDFYAKPLLLASWGVYLPVLVTLICGYLVVRKRKFTGYALFVAGISAVLVTARIFLVMLEYELSSYSAQELLMAGLAVAGPFLAIAFLHSLPSKKPKTLPEQPPDGVAHR